MTTIEHYFPRSTHHLEELTSEDEEIIRHYAEKLDLPAQRLPETDVYLLDELTPSTGKPSVFYAKCELADGILSLTTNQIDK